VSHVGAVPGGLATSPVTGLADVRQLSPAAAALVAPPPPVQWAPLAGADPGVRADLGVGRGPATPSAADPLVYATPPMDLFAAARASRPALTVAVPQSDLVGVSDPAPSGRAWSVAAAFDRVSNASPPAQPVRPALAVSQRDPEDLWRPTATSADGAAAESGTATAAERRDGVRRGTPAQVGLPWEAAERPEEPAELTDPGAGPGPVAVTGLAATAGYVLLNTRAGAWLLSLLAARPLWRQLDPLEILFAWEDRKDGQANDQEETLLSLVE
jgi:hypothetical protein